MSLIFVGEQPPKVKLHFAQIVFNKKLLKESFRALFFL